MEKIALKVFTKAAKYVTNFKRELINNSNSKINNYNNKHNAKIIKFFLESEFGKDEV